jgi:hypothetical protein
MRAGWHKYAKHPKAQGDEILMKNDKRNPTV